MEVATSDGPARAGISRGDDAMTRPSHPCSTSNTHRSRPRQNAAQQAVAVASDESRGLVPCVGGVGVKAVKAPRGKVKR